MAESFKFFITGHKGLETALFHELRDILEPASDKSKQIKKVYGGVEVSGGLELAYRICLYSRLANRVYLQLAQFKADNEQLLYDQVYAIDWSRHLTSRHSFAVSASLSRSHINHSHFASLKVKDAIVDYFRNTVNSRPVIEKQQPDIHVHLNIHKNNASLSLDLSGQSLHRRGYRLQHSGAPLKENLAAALLQQSGWNRQTAQTHSLLDPMCGSGTFAIEAAMIAANIAPGLDRDYFGFTRWLQHDKALWQLCLDQAEQAIEQDIDCEIVATDISNKALQIAQDNAARAGVEDLIQFRQMDVEALTPDLVSKPAIFIINPPYGERLEVEEGLANLYSQMGKVFRKFNNARINIISANPDLLHRLRLNRTSKKSVNNGQLKCVFAQFDVVEAVTEVQPQPTKVSDLNIDNAEANALHNRLLKNDKHLSRWARRNDVSCYRIYDADLPEFAFALDKYSNALNPGQSWLHLQEYQAPKTVDPDKAQQRIELAQVVIKQLFELGDAELFSKLRQRQRGKQQYEKQDKQGELFQVREGAARLLVNLTDYLDTGLFLDHRITRQRLFDQAQGKSLLNLFCYTASVSVQAALGGASQVTSVDMSSTYIHWAKENFILNQLEDQEKYRFITADCLDLLQRPQKYDLDKKFDLIFLDPPSFSNSKKMREILDIQHDHQRLIDQAMQLLAKGGRLIFSTNKKGFKLSESVSQQYAVNDITRQTIPEDFKRRPKIHQCWQIAFK
ncbi:MAG: bifunctional 23S rRNA (guanine(2069)-N(7))-methyltransferase RlmK/23S rRNA (guanine(2445)-N(2))-methyltransferase RlmL [Gammaproteobacteria bacterium]|nr:bifunctional 23S rRNA (guanine(2069)-N(7))-methyltransferase RlmK/23S rRNA (guanine(2445)-N(2))-methyltransferase RlmL [Gammaproteobacteria bacterium]